MRYRSVWVHPKAVCQYTSFSLPFRFFFTNSQSLSYLSKHPMLHLLTLINSPPPAFYLILKDGRGKYPILLGREYRFNSGWQLAFSSADEEREAQASSLLSSLDHGRGDTLHLLSPPSTHSPTPRLQPSSSSMFWHHPLTCNDFQRVVMGENGQPWAHLPPLTHTRSWHGGK